MSKRSRFGCRTCKIRRVKCDETQPFCRRCIDTGRQCDGPCKDKAIFLAPIQFESQRTSETTARARSATTSPPKQLNPVPGLLDSGRRALSYFIECAGPALGGELDQEFWHGSVLQLSHQSTMVQNAVLAVSTLYEKPLSNPLSWPTSLNANFCRPEQRQAFKWYNESLNGMSAILNQPQDREHLQLALTTCVLFACIEFQQLNVVNSIQLLKCGYNLLGQAENKILVSRSPIIRHVLLPMFIRQTIVLLLHGYPLPQDWLPTDLGGSDKSTTSISSLQDARTQLFLIMLEACSIVFQSYATFDKESLTRLESMRSYMLARCQIWRTQLDSYVKFIRQHQVMSPSQNRALSYLELYYLVTTVWLKASRSQSEMVYDNFTRQFISMLDHIEVIISLGNLSKVLYTFEMGVIPPLFFIAWRCRIPEVRRRALRLMKQAPDQESLFHKEVNLFAVRKIIELEEGLTPGIDPEDVEGIIPAETARLRNVMIRWQPGPRNDGHRDEKCRPHLICSEFFMKEDENGEVREMRPTVMPI